MLHDCIHFTVEQKVDIQGGCNLIHENLKSSHKKINRCMNTQIKQNA